MHQALRQSNVRSRPGFHVEHADVVVGLPSGQLDSCAQRYRDVVTRGVLDQANSATEKRANVSRGRETRYVEHPGALEKERPFLGEEQRKPCQVDLSNIGLGFGEVGIDGDGGIHIRRHVLENVDPARDCAVAVLGAI